MVTSLRFLAFIILFLYSPITQGQNSEINWNALNRDKIIVEEITSSSGIPGVRVFFVVQGTRKAIWETLLDYENFPYIFQGIIKMKVLEQDSNGAQVEFWVDAVLMDLHYILFRDYAEPGYRLTWQQVAGDLSDIQGSWQILDTDDIDKKLMIYESYVDIGFLPVTWLIRLGAKRKAVEMGHRMRAWIENH